MSMQNSVYKYIQRVVVCLLVLVATTSLHAEINVPVSEGAEYSSSADRISILIQQINLLKNRYSQSQHELTNLQRDLGRMPIGNVEDASKNLQNKAMLDITVAKSNLDSINIELADARQAVIWLEKNIQAINNQLNVVNVFGAHIAKKAAGNTKQLQQDLNFQQQLLTLENERVNFLLSLQSNARTLLQARKDQLGKLNSQLKSRNLLKIQQQEVRDELMFQEQQNEWLQKLSQLYAKLAKIDPANNKTQYAEIEDQIYSANEHANYAYTQSLLARYREQIQQLGEVDLKSSSISQLNQLHEQTELLKVQLDRLGVVITTRMNVLHDHVTLLAPSSTELKSLQNKYQQSTSNLSTLNEQLGAYRVLLDKAMEAELSLRQGFPAFDSKTFIDIGKEILLVPALGFQVVKSLGGTLLQNIKVANAWTWGMFAVLQGMLIFIFSTLNRLVKHLLVRPKDCSWREKINSKWLSLKWLDHHFVDLYALMAVVTTMAVFNVPFDNYVFFVYLAAVWFIFKSIIVAARVCLVESTSHTAGKDMRLYQKLKWIFAIGGVMTAAAVFVYQLPLIYELKTLSDRLLLLFLMVVSIILLRFWDVVPNLIVSHMENQHPYFEKTIRILGVLVPLLLLGNSVMGLLGYLNLVMTMTWHEGIFLVVLIAYLLLRGLLTDGVEQLSRVVIQYTSNGWLLTEAFLKPLDRVLRLFLFLLAGASLFVFYGWDKQSPMVERLNGLLHFHLFKLLNTSITPFRILCLTLVISVFYWTAKWTREFVFRLLSNRTNDMGIRNSVAILSQYTVVIIGVILCLQVLGINSSALAAVTAALAFGVGLGLRDLANNFFCGFLILLERPLRVGDIIAVNEIEGEVINIGGRAVTVMTWDHTALVVPNAEIFNRTFTNLTARDNVLRCVVPIKISRHDNPHHIQTIIHRVINENRFILDDPMPEVFLKEMNDLLLSFELRFYVNIRQVKSRTMVVSALLMSVWDAFDRHGIKPPYPQQEIFIRREHSSSASAMLAHDQLEDRPLLRDV